MAILAGDGLLTEAFAVMAAAPAGADATVHARKLRVIGIVARAAGASGMVGGQALDLTGNDRDRGDVAAATSAEQLALISAKKTGALIRASAVAGAIMGGATDHDVTSIDDAAAQFGLAFQIIDDILDVEGVASTLGKTVGKDAAAGKPTYPAIYGLDAARRMAGECLEKAERSLRSAHLTESRLMDIGRWIVDRSN
jgi:geranylgeranyl pyrophosphate synthase